MTAMLFLVNALVAVGLILLILLQRAETGAGGAFGGGAGSAQPVIRNPLAKPTAILAAIFLGCSLLIAYTQQGKGHYESVVDAPAASTLEGTAPAADLSDLTEMLKQMDAAAARGETLPEPELPPVPMESTPQ